MNSSDIRNRELRPLEIQELPISRLVPGEFLLETNAVEQYKASINAGNEIEAPRVTPIEDMYYVQDGNHRIMAMKLLGFKSVRCRIQPYRPVTNIAADYETDQFHRAVKNNHVGFTGIKMGSSDEKAKNYEDEDDDLFEQEVLDNLCSENGASDLEEGQDDEDFFAMANVSIFDRLVTNEDSHTQLLCNLMNQSAVLRRGVLEVLFPGEKWSSQPMIKTQVGLVDCGRADIEISTDHLYAIVEVKLSLWCGLTGNQDPDACTGNEVKGYIGALKRRVDSGRRAKLVFLVPSRWNFREKIEESLTKNRSTFKPVTAAIKCWEDILPKIANCDPADPVAPFAEHFHKLLNDRFGPVWFSEEESHMLQVGEDFLKAFGAVRKVQVVIEQVADDLNRLKRGYKLTLGEREQESYGYYAKQGKGYLIWFGIWENDALKKPGPQQLCIGVDQNWGHKITNAFRAACQKEKKEPFEIEGGKWVVSWISDKSLMPAAIMKEIKPILDHVSKASRTISGSAKKAVKKVVKRAATKK